MAKKFKDYYDLDCAQLIAEKLKKQMQRFRNDAFLEFMKKNLKGKEFLDRQDLYVEAFERFLTGDYEKNLAIFSQILGPELKTTTGMFTYGWWLWPLGRYVEKHGTENSKLSMKFIYELTKRFTGEFAVRPIITREPRKTLKAMVKWSKDTNVHVRRLASEGLRIRLPWAKKSFSAVNEFKLFKMILTNLKYDKEKFVQKSVGNNLNDLMKENPDAAKEIITEWENDNPSNETLWIIKHGLRSLRKKK